MQNSTNRWKIENERFNHQIYWQSDIIYSCSRMINQQYKRYFLEVDEIKKKQEIHFKTYYQDLHSK